MQTLSPLIALAAGMLSLLSPCILPILPVYLACLVGPEVMQREARKRRWMIFWHSVLFIGGFSIVFIGLGTLAGLTGMVLSAHSTAIRWISGGLMVLFGLFMLVSPFVSWLNYEKRLTSFTGTSSSLWRSFLIGLVFALAWTPCVGPVLGGILSLALNSNTVWQGTLLLSFYSLGAAIPFILIGLAFQYLQPLINRLKRYSSYVSLISGGLLIGVGILILLNKLSWLAG
jgi:cytochrome c-type biogenesis protein